MMTMTNFKAKYMYLFSCQDVQDESERPFYESDKEDDKSDDGSVEHEAKPRPKPFVMDSDHRLLLRQAKPLLNSRNAAVGLELFYAWLYKTIGVAVGMELKG